MSWIDRAREVKEHPGISYSALKRLNVSPKIYKAHIQLDETDSMMLGSALETYLCFGEEEFNKYYTVLKTPAPTGQLLKFCKALVDLGSITEENFDKAFIATEAKIGTTETFKNKWLSTEAKAYTLECLEAREKTAVPVDVYQKILDLTLKCKTNPFLEYIFKNPIYQVPLYRHDVERDLYLKGLADIVFEKDGTLYIIDIKTTALGVSGFLNTILKYRYDLQASWYVHLANRPCVFQFLVLDTKFDDEPVIYELSQGSLDKARDGFTLNNGRKFKGWNQLLDELVEHKKLDMWDYPMDIYKSKGIVKLDL